MPLPAIVPLLAWAGGTIANSIIQHKRNKRQEQIANENYEKQKKDDLTFWAQQNEYNAPKQQLARYKEAGINPMIAVAGGNANAGPASSLSAPTPQQPNLVAPQLDTSILQQLAAVANIKNTNASTNNLREQNEVIKQELALKTAMEASKLTDNEYKRFRLELDRSLAPGQLDMQKEQIRGIRQGTDINMQRNEREAIMQSQNIQESIERVGAIKLQNLQVQENTAKTAAERNQITHQIQEIQQRIKASQQDVRLKQFEEKLNTMGFTKTDPAWQRIILQYLDPTTGMDNLKKIFSSPYGLFELLR